MTVERRICTWESPVLGRDMNVASWGYFGRPVLLFPTAGGDFLECERFLMIQVLSPLIESGRIEVYAIDSVSGDGWLNRAASPAQKSLLQAQFDAYLSKELLPFIRHDCGETDQGFIATGASLGAYNALNAICKHPTWFSSAICMSGTYDFDRWMDGHRDDNYYFNQPMYFMPNLEEGPQLSALRERFVLLATGTGRWEAPWESDRVGVILGAKGVPNRVEKWGQNADHDWPTWRTMLPLFLDRLA